MIINLFSKTRAINFFNIFFLFVLYSPIIPIVILIRLISPIYLIRFHGLISSRIGHLAANTELYLCEVDAGINVPNRNYVDIFYPRYYPICNNFLLKKWEKEIHILPKWFIHPIYWMNKIIPGGKIHEIGDNTQHDRDVHNLLEKFPTHLTFTKEEEEEGVKNLKKMGINIDDKFVCLIVRDNAYLEKTITNQKWKFHNYRDCDINNYILASEYLISLGYFVIRMGAIVTHKLKTDNPRIIDYATNGMRSEFMDIYLGAKCFFCISSSLGWDSIPEIFNRPILYTNILPIGYIRTSSSRSINLSKKFFDLVKNRELTLDEIISSELCFLLQSIEYEKKGVKLMENTSEEILDAVKEMNQLVLNNFQLTNEQIELQKIFWKKFPSNSLEKNNQRPLHGKINSLYSSTFLKKNPQWLI